MSGQCGKLKCCLNYELSTYLEALQDIPKKEIKLKTKKGTAICQKVDIFNKRLWYTYLDDPIDWYELEAAVANDIINMNKKGELINSLRDFSVTLSNDEKKIKRQRV